MAMVWHRQRRRRDQFGNRLARHCFQPSTRQLHIHGKLQCEIDHRIVAKGHAHLDRVRHSHLILLNEKTGQVELQIKQQQIVGATGLVIRDQPVYCLEMIKGTFAVDHVAADHGME